MDDWGDIFAVHYCTLYYYFFYLLSIYYVPDTVLRAVLWVLFLIVIGIQQGGGL